MKIKVIDLLNMISKGKEVPKKIKYQGDIYLYDEEFELYMLKGEEISLLQNVYECDLTDEIELIEEDKEIEELNLDTDKLRGIETPRAIDYLLEGKINSLVKAVNELKKGK